MDDEALLSNLDQVESLIISLYEPNPPEVISRTQGILSRLQCSSKAWTLAHDLLERANEKTKFFGALTIIVKLNLESSSLSDAEAVELLASLIRWYIEALQSGQLVQRKLSSALAVFFCHFHRLWDQFIRHLIICLASHQSWHPSVVQNAVDDIVLLSNLGSVQIQAILWVVTNTLEDATRLDLNATKNIGLYDCIIRNIPDAVSLMTRCMSREQGAQGVKEVSIRCLQSWILFTQRASLQDTAVVSSLRPLFGAVIDSLVTEELYGVSAEVLTEALSTYPPVLVEQHHALLEDVFKTEWFQDKYQRLLSGDSEFDAIQLGQLLLAYGETRMQVLVDKLQSNDQELLSAICGLLAAHGYPVVEDKIFVPAIEFWSTFAETIADCMSSDGQSDARCASLAVPIIMRAVSNACQRIVYPPSDVFYSWDSDDRVGFGDARKDVMDFLQSVYVVVGPQLVVTFSTLTLSSLSVSSSLQLEAAAFCLGGLADCSREDVRCDDAIAAVFSSPLFIILQENQANIPLRTRQTCIALIEQYRKYFERNADLLPAALNLLFSEVLDHAMAIPAARSIYRLCSSCRSHLQPEIVRFLDKYQSLVFEQLDCFSREKIMGALASIAQAIPEERRRYDACARILGFLEDDMRASLAPRLLTNSDEPLDEVGVPCSDASSDELPELHMALRALRCLASVGKGFQAPSDTSIDLESGPQTENRPIPGWVQLQERTLKWLIEIQDRFSGSTEITELICCVLRSGFSETSPGPFVFSASDIARYLVRQTIRTPRVGVVVSTACSFMSSLRPQIIPYGHQIFFNVLLWVIGLLRQLPGKDTINRRAKLVKLRRTEPESEPELSQNSIEFVSRLLHKSPETFIRIQPPDAAEFFFVFTLQVLDSKEPLPKAAAADFWSTFVGLLRAEDSALQESVRQAMNMLGPLLSQSLARNIGGNASRSELDKLCEPLKKLMRFPRAKEWLHSGLHHASFPSSRITPEHKEIFLKKLVSLRGARATNQVVREFWVDARGSKFAYTS